MGNKNPSNNIEKQNLDSEPSKPTSVKKMISITINPNG
jgi:hypothetical protein